MAIKEARQLPSQCEICSPFAVRSKGDRMPTKTAPRSEAAKASIKDGFKPEQVKELTDALNALLADYFALYIKTKNFHWHMSGPHFRDYHLLLDEQADQIFKVTDDIAERVRKVGGQTIRSIGQIAKLQRINDNDYEFVPAHGMLEELYADNQALVGNLRKAHEVASDANDYATTSLIEVWIDEAERRAWFLFESTR
jgi:starvation-inducible DNA-binding protein